MAPVRDVTVKTRTPSHPAHVSFRRVRTFGLGVQRLHFSRISERRTQRGAFCNYQPCRRVGTLCGLPGGRVMNFGSLEIGTTGPRPTERPKAGLKNFAEGRERLNSCKRALAEGFHSRVARPGPESFYVRLPC
jgi:hypothetical protein